MSDKLDRLVAVTEELVKKLDEGFTRNQQLALLQRDHNAVSGTVEQHHDSINRLDRTRIHLMGEDGHPGHMQNQDARLGKIEDAVEVNQTAIQTLLEKHNAIALKVGLIVGGVAAAASFVVQYFVSN